MTGDQAIRALLELDYRFFSLALRSGAHPCVVEQLHADWALEQNYASLIACVRGSTLDDARRVIAENKPSAADEAFVAVSAWVLTIVSIHGRHNARSVL